VQSLDQKATRPIRILSIDGGGIRGLLPSQFLTSLESETGRPTHELFDVVTGSSIGALIAIGLVTPQEGRAPRSALEITGILADESEEVFRRRHFIEDLPFKRLGLAKVRYGGDSLEEFITTLIGDETLLTSALCRLLVPAVDLQRHRLKLFDSARVGSPYLMKDVALATTAAPSYFNPHVIEGGNGIQATSTYVDGSAAANNPSALAVAAEAEQILQAGLTLVSLGTGKVPDHQPKDFRGSGLIDWRDELAPLVINSSSDATFRIIEKLVAAAQTQATSARPIRQFRIDPKLSHEVELDDASEKAILTLGHAYQDWKKADGKQTLHELARILT